MFPKGSLKVTERKGHKILEELLAPSRFNRKGVETRERGTLQGKGCYKCGKCGTNNKGRKIASGIVNCGVLSEANKFRSNSTGEEFNITQNINCNSTNIIYLVTCKRCGMQGLGKAAKFNKRISNYITQIEKKIEACCTNKHFCQIEEHSLEDFSIMGTVKLENPPEDPKALDLCLREFEGYWQVRLNTLEPYGMNSRNEYGESRRLIKLGIIKSRSYVKKN